MSFLGQEEQLREFQDRFRYFSGIVGIGLCILLGRLVYLQIITGEEMKQYSEDNRIKSVRVRAPRGMLFDRNRTLLVDNRPSFDLEITPQYLREAEDKEAVLKKVSELVDYPLKRIKFKLKRAAWKPSFLPVKIKPELSRDEVAKIETWKINLPGVSVRMEIERTNVYGDTASQFLGYIGKVQSRELKRLNADGRRYDVGDFVGRVGVEKEYESQIKGVDGEELVEVDALGRRIRHHARGGFLSSAKAKETRPGNNLVLTIDQDLQLAAKEAFGNQAGALVAIDPRNGEVLAAISRPSFDSTEFARGISSKLWRSLLDNDRRPLRDRTIQDHYQPGSVFKVITAIAGLEEGVITPNTLINCPGYVRVGNRQFRCNKASGHGNLNVIDALQRSCNIFFQRVALKLPSVDVLASWARSFGLGRKTGIRNSREVPGLIPTVEWKKRRRGRAWTKGETASVAIGQSFVLTTVAQLANLFATIANGGSLFKPYYVKSIETHEGQLIEKFQPELVSRIDEIKPETLDIVRKGLWKVINTKLGTGYWQRIPGVNFAGKTGTAQVIRLNDARIFSRCETMKYELRHHAVFAGFAPVENPVIAVAVITEHGCHGANGAAPMARAVITKYLEKYYPDSYGKGLRAQAELLKKRKLAKKRRAAAAAQTSAASGAEIKKRTEDDDV